MYGDFHVQRQTQRALIKRLMLFSGLAGLVLSLAGCDQLSPDPECGSSASQDLVVQIAEKNLNNDLISEIRSSARTEKIRQVAQLQQQFDALVAACGDKYWRPNFFDNQDAEAARYGVAVTQICAGSTPHFPEDVNESLADGPRPDPGVDDPQGRMAYNDALAKRALEDFQQNILTIKQQLDAAKADLTNSWNSALQSASYKLDTIRMTAKDMTTKKISCVANLTVQVPDWGTATKEITYEIEVTADKALYGTVHGLN